MATYKRTFTSYISIPDPTSEIGVPTTRLTLDEMFQRFGETEIFMNFYAIDERLMAVHNAKSSLDRLSNATSKCVIS